VPAAVDRTRALRGAVAGAVAAGVWALQQPLDKKVFGCEYDDVELLGRSFGGERWYPVGLTLHIVNGALFGAAYATVAPALPAPAAARGPAVALTENFALWPLTALTDRFHPARNVLPKLSGNRRALAQATWRHLLFGVVLGELDRRFNAEPEPAPLAPPTAPAANYSTNGHGPSHDAATAVVRASVEPEDDSDS
jgi:hypothetical protein